MLEMVGQGSASGPAVLASEVSRSSENRSPPASSTSVRLTPSLPSLPIQAHKPTVLRLGRGRPPVGPHVPLPIVLDGHPCGDGPGSTAEAQLADRLRDIRAPASAPPELRWQHQSREGSRAKRAQTRLNRQREWFPSQPNLPFNHPPPTSLAPTTSAASAPSATSATRFSEKDWSKRLAHGEVPVLNDAHSADGSLRHDSDATLTDLNSSACSRISSSLASQPPVHRASPVLNQPPPLHQQYPGDPFAEFYFPNARCGRDASLAELVRERANKQLGEAIRAFQARGERTEQVRGLAKDLRDGHLANLVSNADAIQANIDKYPLSILSTR